MSRREKIELAQTINYFIALVWLLNGLCCKVLNYVPRHQAIVGSILGEEHARFFTFLIGLGEIFIAIWILSGFKKFTCTWAQIAIVTLMNVLEFLYAKEFLLIGRLNFVFAGLFLVIVYMNTFRWSNPCKSIRFILK